LVSFSGLFNFAFALSYLFLSFTSYLFPFPAKKEKELTIIIEIKLIVAAIYTNFSTLVINDDGVDQMDGYTCGPSAGKLYLRFEHASAPSTVEN
jgi:hypothetical protein